MAALEIAASQFPQICKDGCNEPGIAALGTSRLVTAAACQEEQKFDQPIDRHAKPQVHKQPDISAVGAVPGFRREVRCENKIDEIADHNSNQVLD